MIQDDLLFPENFCRQTNLTYMVRETLLLFISGCKLDTYEICTGINSEVHLYNSISSVEKCLGDAFWIRSLLENVYI